MSGPGDEMSHGVNVGLSYSTDSSLYTESTESRGHSRVNEKQTARVLLEKRRQGLTNKMSQIEQAYLGKSKKQVPYHPLKQPQSNSIIQSIKAAHMNRIKQLENQVAEDQIKINEYVTELRTMKTQQKRLEMEIKKYQEMAGNIPNFMRGQEEELRMVQHELKRAKQQSMRLAQNLALREDDLKRVKQENQRWHKLDNVMQLEDREKLYEENEDLKDTINRQNETILMLTRKGMLEVKNLKCELANERKKHHITQQTLLDVEKVANDLRKDLDVKRKYITYHSLRFAGRRNKTPQDGLESISLITLTGNSFAGMHGQMKLDPELIRHYPKTPCSAGGKPTDMLANNGNDVAVSGSVHGNHTNTPLASAHRSLDGFNQSPTRDTNTLFKQSPVPSLPNIQNAEENSSLSEGSDLSEEEIEMYSSSFGTPSRKDSLLNDSQKSSVGSKKSFVNDRGSDSEECRIPNGIRKSDCSLPSLVDKNGGREGPDGDGRLSRTKSGRVSQNERRVSIDEKSLTRSRSLRQTPPEEGEGTLSQNSDVGRKNSLSDQKKMSVKKSPPMSREERLAKDFADIEEKARSEKARSEAIKTEYEQYLQFNKEIKPGMDQTSKGKLLAALNAIEKGGEPVKIVPFRSGPKEATIFTAAKPRSPTHAEYNFTRATEDLHHGRPTKRSKTPDNIVPSSLDLFKVDAPLEHPLTKSELIKELFGGGNDVDYVPGGTKGDLSQKKSITFEHVGFNDRNNNEPADGDGFYSNPRVSLSNWKH